MRDAPPNPAPPTVPPTTARGFSRKTCPGQARVWPASRRRRVSQGVTPTPQPVTCPGCGQPRHEVPAPRPSGAAVDLPLTRARQGCSETAVSEWFEERGVTASFNSGGMTTAGRPARTRSRVRRSCREGASRPPPASPNPLLGPPPDRPPIHPGPQPAPSSPFLGGLGRGGGGRRAIQPAYPLSAPSPPAFSLSQHQGFFQWVSSLHLLVKVLELWLQHQSFQWIFNTDLL